MTSRRLIAVAALLPLCAGLAHAEAVVKKKPPAPPKPVCNLIKDNTGDATTGPFSQSTPNDPSLDIKSVDVVTNAATLTVWFRLADLDMTWTASGDSSQYGRAYVVEFDVAGGHDKLVAQVSPAGNVWPDSAVNGVVDTTKKEIHFSIAKSKLTSKVKPLELLKNLKASSWRYLLTANATTGQVDDAVGATSYKDQYPSCIKAGT